MDRRTFLTGAGTIGTLGTVGTGLAVRESEAAKARASGLARAVGVTHRTTPVAANAPAATGIDGLALGYLPGSAGMVATAATERAMRDTALDLRWTRWTPGLAAQTSQSAAHSLLRSSRVVELSLGVLRRPSEGSGTLAALRVTAHFAIDDSPYFAPFDAWAYSAARLSTLAKSTPPIGFTAYAPDRLALEVSYQLRGELTAPGIATGGSLYLPVGATSQTPGLATGLYVLAAPTASGILPDLSDCHFSGDVHAPLAALSGRALDFEYLALAIRPAAL